MVVLRVKLPNLLRRSTARLMRYFRSSFDFTGSEFRVMQVTFHASKPMTRFLKKRSGVELTRLPCEDLALVGRVPLQSSPLHVAWQLHIIQTNRDHGDQVLLAMEAFSRYQILIPVTWTMGMREIESTLMHRWLEELLILKVGNPYCGADITGTVLAQLLNRPPQPAWVANMDLSISGHLSDTDQWIASELHQKRRSILRDDHARDLAWYLNNQIKTVKHPEAGKLKIMPAEHMQLLGLAPVGLGQGE